MRLVLDTNVLVAAAYASRSASRRIVDSCIDGTATFLLSAAVRAEYEHILPRALHGPRRRERFLGETYERLLARAEAVEPASTPRVVPDDPDDDKLIALALAGTADFLITSDEHLLVLDGFPRDRSAENDADASRRRLRIVTAGEFARRVKL